ncbi:hypothetical protein [Microbacterium terricola]|uniref:Uncharacterized protein n=1 Tax=Microbacterium terricola TaxID=344163 RepID=A0ABM8E3A4_9MICO|nr:hypothetical protein [Microbacterium terricola]UYK40061.1 hypothetical protein OAU46_15450 [Microbacterium terricola]BDV32242.1 hypothetical protein Microterr_29020 [Microbacterium terricola]
MLDPEDGYLLFETDQPRLLTALKAVGVGSPVYDNDANAVLEHTGLVKNETDPELTEAGLALYRAAFVARDDEATNRLLGQAIRTLLPIQAIAQELGNSTAIPEQGVVDLLALHRIVDQDFTVENARPTFRWLNTLKVLVYSQKQKTVRYVPDSPEAAKAGEIESLAAMISPRTPYSNVAKLRKVLRTQIGVVIWADQHFGARALEELVDELDPTKVTELRILSGSAPNVASPKSFKDYERFRDEMKVKGITVEWRVDGTREWHDRWLIDDKTAHNVPPVNSLFANQYSEILPTKERPPAEEWWKRATPRTE